MSVSTIIKMGLLKQGLKQADLAKHFGLSQVAMNQKFYRESWSAADLIKVGEFLDCKLAFIFPDGQRFDFEMEPKPEGGEK